MSAPDINCLASSPWIVSAAPVITVILNTDAYLHNKSPLYRGENGHGPGWRKLS